MATRTPEQAELVRGFLAPLVTAAFVACAACGLVFALAWAYFTRFKGDRLAFKALVGGLAVLVVVNTACCAKFAGDWAVSGFGDYRIFSRMPWEMSAYCFLGTAVAIVHLWFSWRVWVISGSTNRVLTGIIAAGSLAAYGCIMRVGIFCAQQDELRKFAHVRVVVLVYLVLLTAVDLLISLSIFYYIILKPRHESGGLLSPDSRIHTLASFTAKTNLASLIVQILILSLLLAYPREFHYGTPSFLVAAVYVGSLICTLLARDPSTLRSNGGSAPRWAGSHQNELPSFILRLEDRTDLSQSARALGSESHVLEMEERRPPIETMLSLSGSRDRHGPSTGRHNGFTAEAMLPDLSYAGRARQGSEQDAKDGRGT
ncbi:hypothetical protein JCM11251_000752 [Rhodosporidiobolus azoricus]